MQKRLIAVILVLMIATWVAGTGTALAQPGKLNVKGEVKAIEGGTLTVESNKGETFVIAIPGELDVSAIQAGDSVLVKATAAADGSWVAVSIKKVGAKGQDDEDDDGDEAEEAEDEMGSNAFCGEEKMGAPHPLAPKIAGRYGVSAEWVMEKFCAGSSMGAIMLAVKTSQMAGVTATADELLANQAAGTGWGVIWKDLGLIGSEKAGHSPPGLLKKADKAKPKK